MDDQVIEIPWQELSAEALQGLLEEYASRDGTDYGWDEKSLASKVDQLKQQLASKKIRVVFDQESDTVNLIENTI